MTQMTRRSFVATAAAGIASPGVFATDLRAENGQLVWTASDWSLSDFRKLVNHPARIKQVYDVIQPGEGKFLNNIKNSLNGLHFGFGVPADQIKVVAALHGPANLLNYNDYIWKKYRIGEWLRITDPATRENAERNIFYPAANTSDIERAPKDPNNEHSLFQAKTIRDLQARGVQFLSCHTAAEEQARILKHQYDLSQSPEEIVRDMLAHTVPGVLVVASMVAAIALLQAEGHYTYITV
jgi:intracellular sulfur oxidation DsrE/DsrF family protein